MNQLQGAGLPPLGKGALQQSKGAKSLSWKRGREQARRRKEGMGVALGA